MKRVLTGLTCLSIVFQLAASDSPKAVDGGATEQDIVIQLTDDVVERVGRINDPSILRILAVSALNQKKYKLAMFYALNLRKHARTTNELYISYYSMGKALQDSGYLLQAAIEYEKAVRALEKCYYADRWTQIQRLANFCAEVYMRKNKKDKAIEWYLKNLDAAEKMKTRSRHLAIVSCCCNLGALYSAVKKFDSSIKYYSKALDTAEKFKMDKLRIAEICFYFAFPHFASGKYKDAEKYALRSYNIYKKNLGKRDEKTRKVFKAIQTIRNLSTDSK
jgi:tetratricopeptide (TPR) repeat protein